MSVNLHLRVGFSHKAGRDQTEDSILEDGAGYPCQMYEHFAISEVVRALLIQTSGLPHVNRSAPGGVTFVSFRNDHSLGQTVPLENLTSWVIRAVTTPIFSFGEDV